MKNHPLFPEKPEADISKIHVTRHESGQMKWSPRAFSAEELTELGTVFDLYGGGTYELVGHGPRGIAAKQIYALDGKPKPLSPVPEVDTSQVVAAQASAAGNGGGMSGLAFAAVLLPLLTPFVTEILRMLSAIATRPPTDTSGPMVTMLQSVMQQQGQLMTALLAPRNAAAPPAVDPVKQFLDAAEVIATMRAQAMQGGEGGGGVPEFDVNAIVEGAKKVIGLVKEAKTLADNGATPEQAAAALAASAGESPAASAAA